MKQIIHWIKTHTGLLKTLFVIAVSIMEIVIDDGYRFSFRYSDAKL